MGRHEFCRLDKHTTISAAEVVHTVTKRFNHFYQRIYNTGWCVKLPGIFAFLLSKFPKATLVDTAQQIHSTAVCRSSNIGEQIHYFAQTTLVQFRSSKSSGQHAFQPFVFLLNFIYGTVDDFTDFRCVRMCR